jgi:Cu+-exporting ATPase
MKIDKQKMTAHMKYKGQTLYFCTKEERKEFKKDPEGYLSGKKGTCTMTTTTETTTTEPKTQYSCPMHHEVQINKPGKCPKCGMNL